MTALEKQRTEYRQNLNWYASIERDSWELTQEEIIKGLGLFENNRLICSEGGNGYMIEPFKQRFLYILFDPEEVKYLWMKIHKEDWPDQEERLTDEELMSMFDDVREYLDVKYYNVFTEEKILTIYATKKL